METLDCKGLDCPEPVLRTKTYFEQNQGESFSVMVDRDASRENVLHFAKSQGCAVSVTHDGANGFVITLIPGSTPTASNSFCKEDYLCDVCESGNLVYVISSDSMASGSEELGWALLQTYVTTIEQVAPLPSHILLYNGGVKLAATATKGLEALQKLEEKGVTVWSCGTCLEFFHLEKKRKVGSITNMYDIMNTMATAAKVVSPY